MPQLLWAGPPASPAPRLARARRPRAIPGVQEQVAGACSGRSMQRQEHAAAGACSGRSMQRQEHAAAGHAAACSGAGLRRQGLPAGSCVLCWPAAGPLPAFGTPVPAAPGQHAQPGAAGRVLRSPCQTHPHATPALWQTSSSTMFGLEHEWAANMVYPAEIRFLGGWRMSLTSPALNIAYQSMSQPLDWLAH